MKNIKLVAILSLIYSFGSFGQDYQTINSNRISYFDNKYSNIKCIRIDSVKYQTDSILYPFMNIQQLDYNCFTPYGASWIGHKLIVMDDGLNIFFNKDLDSIKIKPNASLGDIWTVYELKDSIKIIATIINFDTMSFIGLIDSVKTVGFQVYDKNMNLLGSDLNNMTLLLSKNYGFIKAFNFYLFPNYQVDYPFEQFEEFDLIGLSNPKVGVQNLTWFEVNDFQIGDELHVLDESSSWGGGYDYSTTNKAIYKYLERTDYQDSIVYTYSRKQSIYTIWADSNSFIFIDDTLMTIIKPDSIFDKLPGEPIVTDDETYNYSMTNGLFVSKTNTRSYESFYFSGDLCWGMIMADGCLIADSYITGLGGPYYQCDNAFSLGGAERNLVYYKKGQITWGTPLIVTGISNNKYENNIELFPNPAKENIWIKSQTSDLPFTFELIDISGQTLVLKEIKTSLFSINVDELPNRIYLYRLSNKNEMIKFGKLIIE